MYYYVFKQQAVILHCVSSMWVQSHFVFDHGLFLHKLTNFYLHACLNLMPFVLIAVLDKVFLSYLCKLQVHENIPHFSWPFLPLFSSQLLQLRGNEKKFTLLHALVEQIMLHEPRLATFFQELTEFETFPGGRLIKIAKWQIRWWHFLFF